ncbi:MAG TPA: Holliday junction resolvase RuvX [Vicinamibacterales bacterium]|nr:Holliday junction resolvase RuvX [Vicinamibacterales bacterium]
MCYAGFVRVMAVDYGDRRIGLALSDVTGLLARPWKTIEHAGDLPAAATRVAADVHELATEEDGLGRVVVGLPRRLGGEPNTQTARVETFCDLLRQRVDVDVVLQDERLSSHAADELLARRERDWRRRKAQLDAMAAAVILQDFLDGQPARRAPDQPPEDL